MKTNIPYQLFKIWYREIVKRLSLNGPKYFCLNFMISKTYTKIKELQLKNYKQALNWNVEIYFKKSENSEIGTVIPIIIYFIDCS
jgi:hypothetical protein